MTEPTAISPTPGRMVWFFADANQTEPLAAIVAHVWNDRMVNLAVIDKDGSPFCRTSVHLVQPGDPGPATYPQARWMPYQVGQAKRTEQAEAKAPPSIEPTLKRLFEATDRALAEAKRQIEDGNESLARGAFNFADLKCIDAELCVSVHGDSTFRVTIDEADPHNPELRQFVTDQLANAGFEKVDVVTEW
jgi:hypothetical protein